MAHSRGGMVVDPTELKQAAEMVSNAKCVALLGTGGNLAIAQHMASDMYRHLDKFCFAPDSVNQTALGGDSHWHGPWLDYATKSADLVILITCRINSPAVYALGALERAWRRQPPFTTNILLVAPEKHDRIPTLVVDATHYHEFEVFAMMALYNVMEECGVELPQLPSSVKSQDVPSRCNVYCIDIDGTLTEPHDGDPWNAVPRRDRIKKINQLYDDGATIYLQTARGSIVSQQRFPNDPQAQQRNADYMYRSRTEQQLDQWGVKYHQLYFGKPRASAYVDDRGHHDSEFFNLIPTEDPPFWHPV